MAAQKPNKDVEQMTVAELRSRATELEITGRSSMKKDELRQAVIDAEEQTARLAAAKGKPKAKPRAQTAKAKANGAAKKDGAGEKKHAADGIKPASEISAPSIGPHTVIEHTPPEERLAKHEPSEVDAMGLDKRRGVTGKRYGASFAKQATVYGGFLLVVAALLIGGKLAADELDAPPATNPDEAPWSQADAKQHPPTDIDFPRTISP